MTLKEHVRRIEGVLLTRKGKYLLEVDVFHFLVAVVIIIYTLHSIAFAKKSMHDIFPLSFTKSHTVLTNIVVLILFENKKLKLNFFLKFYLSATSVSIQIQNKSHNYYYCNFTYNNKLVTLLASV